MNLPTITQFFAGDATSFMSTVDLVESTIGRLATKMVSLGMQYEKDIAGFEVMTGSLEKATQLYNQLEKLAIDSPFKSIDFAKTGQSLMGAGVAASDVLNVLGRLGDLAQGDADKLQRLAHTYGQVMAMGKMQGYQLRSFTNAGIGVQDFADTMEGMQGNKKSKFLADMQNGIVPAELMVKTINRLTEAGGRFYGSMSKMNLTVSGQWNALTETMEMFGRRVAEKVFKKFDVAGNLGSITKWMEPLLGYIDPVLNFFSKLGIVVRDSFDIIQVGFKLGIDFVGKFLEAISPMTPTFEQIREGGREIFKAMIKNFANFLDNAKTGIKAWATYFLDATVSVHVALSSLLKPLLKILAFKEYMTGNVGSGDLLVGMAESMDSEAYRKRMEKVKRNLIEMGNGPSFLEKANKELAELDKNKDRSWIVGAIERKVGPLTGPIQMELKPDPKVLALATEIQKAIEKGLTPLDHFSARMNLMREGLLGRNGTESTRVLTPGEFEFGAAQQFRELEKSLGNSDRSVTAGAFLRSGSSEAQEVLNASRTQEEVRDVQKRIEDVLDRSRIIHEKTLKENKDIAAALKKMADEGKFTVVEKDF